RLTKKVSRETGLTLLYALERGIEATFQLEDTELSGEMLPDEDGHARMLLVESAEGGAGGLRRLVEEEGMLAVVAAKALEIAHFAPDTGEDQGGRLSDDLADADEQARCVQACYDCLLSYSNQPYHRLIDRHQVVGLLRALATSTTRQANAPKPDV